MDTAPENIERLLSALSNWGDGYVRELSAADFELIPGAVRLVEDFPLDMFTVLAGKTYADFLPDSRIAETGVRFLSPSALISTKEGTHREKDQIDILALKGFLDS